MTNTQHTTESKAMSKNERKNFTTGYNQALAGVTYNPELSKYPGYDAGYDAGLCDRPTLEELQPLDVAKERSTGCLI